MQTRRGGSDPPGGRHGSATGRLLPTWENVHAFLQVIEHGSFRSAALKLGLPINRLRHRVAKLEQQLGVTLMTRHVDGVRASTEGLGTFWLAPRLAEFRRTHPNLLVDLRCAMRPVDMLRLEADAGVQLVRPGEADLKVVKLGRLHVMPYAAASYVETYGVPDSVEALSRHRLVFQVAEQTAAREFHASVLGDRPQAGLVCVRTNSSSAHALAVASGAGIGWLATYASAIAEGLVAIDLDARSMFDVWLTYHPDVARIPRVRHVIDWVVDSFDPRRFPWFRDEFVHPREFAGIYRGEPLFNVSGHFAEDEVPFIEFPDFMLRAGGRHRTR